MIDLEELVLLIPQTVKGSGWVPVLCASGTRAILIPDVDVEKRYRWESEGSCFEPDAPERYVQNEP